MILVRAHSRTANLCTLTLEVRFSRGAALDVADDVRTVHCDVVAVGIAEDEGRMDSPALDRRNVKSEALPFCVRCFEVFDHEIEGRVRITWRCTRQEHEVCPTAQFQHNNLVIPLDLAHADSAPEVR